MLNAVKTQAALRELHPKKNRAATNHYWSIYLSVIFTINVELFSRLNIFPELKVTPFTCLSSS